MAENRSGVDLRGPMTPLLASMEHLELFSTLCWGLLVLVSEEAV